MSNSKRCNMFINRSLTVIKSALTVFTLLWSFNCLAVTPSELEKLTPQQAFKQGKILYSQYKIEQSKSYLKYATGQGIVDAAWVYAVVKNKGGHYLRTPVDVDYALKSAQNGNLKAMKFLASFDYPLSSDQKLQWKSKFYAAINQGKKQGDGEAVYSLVFIKSIEYPMGAMGIDEIDHGALKKSAELGYPEAQYELAKGYEAGDGTFFIPRNREKEIKRLYKEAAEEGYPPAMSKYSYILSTEDESELAKEWILKKLDTGAAGTLLYLAQIYSGDDYLLFPNSERPYSFIKEDKVKAIGLYQAYYSSMNINLKGSSEAFRYSHYQKVLASLTAEQKAQANKFAQDYLATHTVRAFDGFWQWGVDYGTKPTDE